MVTIKTNGTLGKYELNFPSNLSDITKEFLLNVTENVELAANYSLIAICYREKVSNILLAANRNKNKIESSVVPLFVKSGATEDSYVKSINTLDKLVIAGSDIAMGYHITCPRNKVSIDTLLLYTKGDTDIYQKAIEIKDPCYFIDFKIVPNCCIHGHYNSSCNSNFTDDKTIVKLDE